MTPYHPWDDSIHMDPRDGQLLFHNEEQFATWPTDGHGGCFRLHHCSGPAATVSGDAVLGPVPNKVVVRKRSFLLVDVAPTPLLASKRRTSSRRRESSKGLAVRVALLDGGECGSKEEAEECDRMLKDYGPDLKFLFLDDEEIEEERDEWEEGDEIEEDGMKLTFDWGSLSLAAASPRRCGCLDHTRGIWKMLARIVAIVRRLTDEGGCLWATVTRSLPHPVVARTRCVFFVVLRRSRRRPTEKGRGRSRVLQTRLDGRKDRCCFAQRP